MFFTPVIQCLSFSSHLHAEVSGAALCPRRWLCAHKTRLVMLSEDGDMRLVSRERVRGVRAGLDAGGGYGWLLRRSISPPPTGHPSLPREILGSRCTYPRLICSGQRGRFLCFSFTLNLFTMYSKRGRPQTCFPLSSASIFLGGGGACTLSRMCVQRREGM